MRPPIRRLAIVLTVAALSGIALTSPTQAAARDTDRDGMPDHWERAHGLNWQKANAKADPDGDGFSNIREFRLGQDPRHSDATKQCTALETALGATDPSQCGGGSVTEFLH